MLFLKAATGLHPESADFSPHLIPCLFRIHFSNIITYKSTFFRWYIYLLFRFSDKSFINITCYTTHDIYMIYHSWYTTHDIPLMIYHSWYTTHDIPLMIYSWYTTHHIPLMIYHSWYTTHNIRPTVCALFYFNTLIIVIFCDTAQNGLSLRSNRTFSSESSSRNPQFVLCFGVREQVLHPHNRQNCN